MVDVIKQFLRKAGIQVKHFPDRDQTSRQLALKAFGINKIVDVGANTGQFAKEMRDHGFRGEIISFEPLSEAFKDLQKKAAKDHKWVIRNMAIGDSDGEITINVSKNSQSSSILEMLPSHLKSAPESLYINTEKVQIRRIDTILPDFYKTGDSILLKIDTQGYEKKVLDGAETSLSKIIGIKLEMSLIPLYRDEVLFWDMVKFVENKGYKLYSLENTHFDPKNGQLLQVDGIFYK